MDMDGKFLVASPGLLDPNFQKSIILVVDHHKEEGTFGLVLNQPGPVSMGLFCAGMGIDIIGNGEPLVHVGGPVQPGVGWLLHQSLEDAPDSRQVLDGVFISNSREMLDRPPATVHTNSETIFGLIPERRARSALLAEAWTV